MKLIKSVLVLLILTSCISGKNYYIYNATDDLKQIEVHYANDIQNSTEVYSIPDSLGVVIDKDLPYKSYKFYKKSNRQIPFQKINDSIYRVTLQSLEKTMIPYRYSYENSLKKIMINQEEEILFTDYQYSNDSLVGFKTKNTKLGTTVQYETKQFLGDDAYIIQLR